MLNLANIHSVTDFQRNPKNLLHKLKTSKNPLILTVNGKAELIVQDAESYQELLDKVEVAEDLEAIQRGLDQSIAKEGRSATDFFQDFEQEYGI